MENKYNYLNRALRDAPAALCGPGVLVAIGCCLIAYKGGLLGASLVDGSG